MDPQEMAAAVGRVRKAIDEAHVSDKVCTNHTRRCLYSDVELTRIDLESTSRIPEPQREAFHKELTELGSKLSLRSVYRKPAWWRPLDYAFRFIGLNALFFTSGAFFSLPILAARALDNILVKVGLLSPKYKLSELMKVLITKGFVLVSGVALTVDGIQNNPFDHSCSIMTFSHASNLDGFMISSTCPIPHYALAKKELFLIPFFSWVSLAIGGVPVDRNHRDRAVLALQRSTEAAKSGNMCVVIAPEGTRSTTGQLREFKKGTFHMWEQLQVPIVPFISYGAFELFPKNSWINTTGRVHVRYLKPILPTEAATRQEMLYLVRRRMLEAFKECPPDLDQDIGTGHYLLHLLFIAGILLFDYAALGLLVSHFRQTMTLPQVLLKGGLWSMGITLGLFVYYTYLIYMWPFASPPATAAAGSGSSSVGKKRD